MKLKEFLEIVYDYEELSIIQAKVKKEFGAFGKPQINVGFDLSGLEPAPMNKEDAEFTAKLAYLAFRGWGAVRVEVQEVK